MLLQLLLLHLMHQSLIDCKYKQKCEKSDTEGINIFFDSIIRNTAVLELHVLSVVEGLLQGY